MNPAEIKRKTNETDISVRLDLSGGPVRVDTGIGFFDHMLTAFGVHGGFGLEVFSKGDLATCDHHTVEDTGIALGQAFSKAVDRAGICRFGHAHIPMDEALAFAAVDVCGRPFLKFDAPMPQEKIGTFDSCLALEFMRAFAVNAGVTLHMTGAGENAHHITEALFKALAHGLRQALIPQNGGVLSSKGVL